MRRIRTNLLRLNLFAGVLFLTLCVAPAFAGEAWDRISRTKELRLGGDAAGGAPFIYPDPDNPSEMIGFEIDILNAIAKKLNIGLKFVNVPWDQLVPALQRDDFDIAFNGLEITKGRQEVIRFTIPYYFFSEQISVRKETNDILSFSDLRGRRVGTLSATLAQNMMDQDGHITVVAYPTPVEAYRDLDIGRVEAVLLDNPIAAFYIPRNPKLKNIERLVGEGIYAGGIRKDSPLLQEKINHVLAEMIHSGELEKIYQKWNLWNENQENLKLSAIEHSQKIRGRVSLKKYIPILLQGAGVTILLSFLAMAIAITIGFILALGKLYGTKPLKVLANTYIEVIRGTPLLIQLYLLYYGLPNIGIQLNAFVAAVLGLGLNYAAYEAEIYRAGLLSIPKGQDEAARSLGMTGWQSLKYVLLPQAVVTILPPSTSDFIALFKDTSLVSIITVMELTRAYNQAANTTYRFLELGLLTALLYFLMSFPLSLWSRSLERKRHAAFH